MRQNILAILFATLVIFNGLVHVDGEEKNCKQKEADSNKRKFDGITICTKELAFKNGKEKAAKMMCVLKCVLKRENLLDDTGRMTVDVINTFVAKEIPGPAGEKMKEQFMGCVKVGTELDPTDEFCKSYDPLIKCLSKMVSAGC